MSRFASGSEFRNFAHAVKTYHRHFLSEAEQKFLEAVHQTARSRITALKQGWQFWRAQFAHCTERIERDGAIYERAVACPPKRMKPRTNQAREGRANPKGIPCLYGATDEKTAIAEVRPRFGELVSLALFELCCDATIVDCSRYHAESPFSLLLNTPIGKADYVHPPEAIEKAVWIDIDRAFSEPVTDSDDTADYAPTQVLAELFKSKGYAGVVYKSKLTEAGFNLALFDPNIVRQVYGKMHKVEQVAIGVSETPEDEYFIKEDGTCFRVEITNVRPIPRNGKPESEPSNK